MSTSKIVTNRLKRKFKRYIVFLAMILVTLNGMVPASLSVQAVEKTDMKELEQPIISKDVDGEESKEIQLETDYQYNINIQLPEDVTGYEFIEISDDFDKRLAVQDTAVLIGEEIDDRVTATVDGQKVSLELKDEQVKEFAGKKLTLQITAQVREEDATNEAIENVAQFVINSNIILETNPAIVIPVDSKKENQEADLSAESDEEDQETPNEAVEEEKDNEPEEKVEADVQDIQTNNQASAKKESIAPLNQVQAADGITINDTDSYSITNIDGEKYIIQYDGTNPSAPPKGKVKLDNANINNSLALGKNEDVFYANAGANLYRIHPNGKTELITSLEGTTLAGAISPDGTKYVYFLLKNGQIYISSVDLVTKEKNSVPIQDKSGFASFGGGDLAFDADGNLWFSRWSDDPVESVLAKVDVEEGILESVIPIVADNGEKFTRSGALSFLPNGKFLLLGAYEIVSDINENVFYLFELDPATGIATELTENYTGTTDFASRVYPSIKPDLVIEKKNDPSDEVFPGDTITYTLKVTNTGTLASTMTKVYDELPEGTSYVPGTTTLNGEKVADVAGASPIFTGMPIGSSGESLEGVLYAGEENAAVVTFQVKVNEDVQPGTEVSNTATAGGDSIAEIPSNEVINKVVEAPDSPDACAAPVALINGSFEEPPFSPNDTRLKKQRGWFDAPQGAVPGWKTTDGSGLFEIMNKSLGDEIPSGDPYEALKVTPAHGQQFAELNSREAAQLYQDVDTTPGQTIYWRLAHKGRVGQDTMALKIDSATVDPKNLKTIETMTSGKDEWKYYSGSYVVPAGQTVTRFGFEAISSANGSTAAGNFLDDIFLGTEPCVTAEKSVSPEGDVFAGDELTYEMTIKNSGGDIAANTTIEDAIPEGTEYVPGSMKILNGPKAGDLTDVEDNDAGHFNGEKVIFKIGDLPNTTTLPDGMTVQFKVIALSDHAGKDVDNKAQVKYKDLLKNEDEEIETNETKTPIKYRVPVLKSEKSAEIKEKAEGNTDKENPEVGDTLLYTIKTQNTIKNSVVKNLVISDEIPEGLEYVTGSLKVEDKSVTDEIDDDNGHAVDGKLSGQFGDIKGMDWHTLTFEVKVKTGQAGQDIKNIATVDGDNIDKPDEPEEEVKIYPRGPQLESEKSAVNAEKGKETFEVGDTIVYTIKTHNKVSDSLIENLSITDTLPAGLEYVADSLKVSHEGNGEFKAGAVTANFGDVKDTEWRTVTFEAKILSGQAGKELKNIATVDGDNVDKPDEPEEKVIIDPKAPVLKSEKSAKLETKAEGNTDKDNPEVGDTLLYTIRTQNTIEDSLVNNLVISDEIPAGLEYVAGSLKVDGASVTDEKDNDNGHAVDGKLSGQLGDIKDTDWHTLEFLVKVKAGQAGQDIKNIAFVDGDNIDEPDEPEEEVKIYPREPELESKKFAVNAEKGKEKYEVGDTIVYTIETRNKVSDSVVENLTITDTLPVGLEYVADSLKVSHEGSGEFKAGAVTANFGDVKDTDWRTVTFEAKILSGQAGKELKNIATVDGDNVDKPDEPEEKVIVDPKDPDLQSEKSVKLEAKAEGNTDKDNPEVGDTLLYTIRTQNTIEDSLVNNLVISDEIPEGLEYVIGSLRVDGESVTDVKDGDNGYIVDGKVTGQFGDIKDTKWHTLEFLVKVEAGQAGQDIKNIAFVDGDNIDEPDEPEEEVKIYPREPKLESEKNAINAEKDKETFEVGDTIVYTIKTRNKVSDSVVENLTITDVLPAGLEYVTDSLKASHEGSGEFKDGTITVGFGDVKDTEWRTVTFEATIKSGQSGKELKNIATVDGDNVDKPDEPEEKVIVDPKDPDLQSEKSVKLEAKTDGNTDKENPEVGDTLLYTIKTRNIIEDSLVKNLVISDEIPEGLEYEADSLKVDGQSVTDAKDEDNGHAVDGKLSGQFGDIKDTEWHTLEFLVKVKEGQAGKDIKNIATVDGDNIDEPDKPEEEVKVYPRVPKLESEKSAENAEKGKEKYEVGDTIVYTIKTRNKVSDSLIENLSITDTLPAGLEYVEDSLKVSHEGSGEFKAGAITANFGDVKGTEWRTVTFEAKIKSGQSGKELKNIATVDGDNVDKPDEPEEKVIVDPKGPVLKSEKSAKLEAKAEGNTDKDHPEVGDTLLYTIKTKNTIEDSLVKNLVISDEIPEGLEYVTDSLKVDGQSATDTKDDDKGYAVNGKIIGLFGDIKDTNWHTVEFLVKVKPGQAGKDIQNIAVVGGDNIDKPDKPEEEVEIYPRHSVLESEKSAVNAEKGKEKYEVGDTIVYTIKTRNKITDSLVKNLSITDKLPAGLEYVDGSLKVSHKGTGEFKDGTITANFGDVKDTEWRTVTFEAKVKSGQSEKTIENIATVTGDNIDEPDKPSEKVIVDPKTPAFESEKTAANAEKGKTKFEVGDTVVYTIKARNKESDSLVKNLTITDKLPAGLEYVADSLKVSDEGSGEFKDGTIAANFGDVKDAEWRTVTFEATIQSDQFGNTIKNIATVSSDHGPDPNQPEAKISIEPKDPEPAPEQGNKPETPSSDTTDKGGGKKLPNTATNLFNYGLIGIFAILVGLLVLRRRKPKDG
ncbi:isopeptide-forming domain-containing fimbrial protein [Bacillus norwichensis]|uniref:Isopeptide-forming domain-containing fimbrial protein n=1 Tax=Bacillus norwichensis TaxID=2762217 RepID=A0ABR8VKP9_9BACI|nr:isopeptide-forming domain-containing fimbrial protein [Bacillus norwichensis]MBD8005341.1 isopeptide-forming domain-containing fimbrial protein [Bacillus norwichensis]